MKFLLAWLGLVMICMSWGTEEIVNVPPRTVAHDGPVYERPVAEPKWIKALNKDTTAKLKKSNSPDELATQLMQIITSPNQASKNFITDQYDHFVGGNTALAMPDDAGMIRVDETSSLGIAIATDVW